MGRAIMDFLLHKKKYWLLPLALLWTALALFLFFGGGLSDSPFVYAVF